MATQEISSGNGIKNISIPRSDAYIKLRRRTEVDGFLVDIFCAFQILDQASFRFSPSLCLKLRTSFSGDKGVDKGLAIMTKQVEKRRRKKERAHKTARVKWGRGKREANGK